MDKIHIQPVEWFTFPVALLIDAAVDVVTV